MVEINDVAVKQAATRDAQRRQHPHAQLPLLHGIPIFIKDIIATASPSSEEDEKLNTSAGSLALLGAFPSRDAPVVARLRESGAIILGKTNTVRDQDLPSSSHSPPTVSRNGPISARSTQPSHPVGLLVEAKRPTRTSRPAILVALRPAQLSQRLSDSHPPPSVPKPMEASLALVPCVALSDSSRPSSWSAVKEVG